MLMDRSQYLKRCRILILDDEYLVANDLETELRTRGAEVIGPVARLSDAKSQVDRGAFDAVVMDVTLGDQPAYSIADELVRQHIPFIFATGYSAKTIPDRFRDVTRREKPYDLMEIVNDLARMCKHSSEQAMPVA